MKRARRPFGAVFAVALISFGALVAMSSPAAAAVFTPSPDPTVDGAAGSLREAVGLALANGDEIHLTAGGTYTLNACGGQFSGLGQLVHGNASLTITTPSGAPATIVQTCLGARVLQQGAAALTLDNVIVTGGNQGFPNADFQGGAIKSFGDVTVTSSTFFGNSVVGNPAQGGAIVAFGNLTVTDSTIRNNNIQGNPSFGGAISAANVTVTGSTLSSNSINAFASGVGGAIHSGGSVTVTDSTLSSNSVLTSGSSGGGAIDAPAVTITSSTLSNNSATGTPTTPTIAQGGAVRTTGVVTVTSSTLSNNSANAPAAGTASGGAVFGFGGSDAVSLTNSTVSDNTATDQGGGVFATNLTTVYSTLASNSAPTGASVMLSSTATLTSFATVIALPLGGGANCANLSSTTTNGYNFSDDTSCGFTGGTDDQTGADPLLDALANTGGPTETRLPQTGSPLIDAIPNASCEDDGASGITTDQRGLPRPSAVTPDCDIGAVEVQPLATTPASSPLTARFVG